MVRSVTKKKPPSSERGSATLNCCGAVNGFRVESKEADFFFYDLTAFAGSRRPPPAQSYPVNSAGNCAKCEQSAAQRREERKMRRGELFARVRLVHYSLWVYPGTYPTITTTWMFDARVPQYIAE